MNQFVKNVNIKKEDRRGTKEVDPVDVVCIDEIKVLAWQSRKWCRPDPGLVH